MTNKRALGYMNSRRRHIARAKELRDFKVSSVTDESEGNVSKLRQTSMVDKWGSHCRDGYVSYPLDNDIAKLGRQLQVNLTQEPDDPDLGLLGGDYSDPAWVPVWFAVLYKTFDGTTQVLGTCTDEFRKAVNSLRYDTREQLMMISEFLLTNPHMPKISEASRSFLARYFGRRAASQDRPSSDEPGDV